jgi:uncharacterized phage protein (TIGR02218 family)
MSKPIKLYRFTEDSLVWTLTSSNKSQTYNGETYNKSAIGHSQIKSSPDKNGSTIDIIVDLDNVMARRWFVNAIDTVVNLQIFKIDDGVVTVDWQGRLIGTKPDDSKLTLVFDSGFSQVRHIGLREQYQKTCPHILYGRLCGKNKDDMAVSGTVLTISGSTVTVSAASSKPDGYFNAGMIADSAGVLRFITSHVGTVLTLTRPLDSLSVGMSINLYPGCPRTTKACKDTFNNLANFGGFPWIPSINPYDGTPIA